MKYFTKEWCFSDQNDEEIEYRATSYKEYINKIYKDLPFVLKILSKNVNFYDARINNITLFSDQDVLILNGVLLSFSYSAINLSNSFIFLSSAI